MKCTILCNSNGTLFNDVLKEYAGLFENRYAEFKAEHGIDDSEGLAARYSRLKKQGPKSEFKETLRLYHEIQEDLMGEMDMRSQPGLESFLASASVEGFNVSIFANAPQAYLRHVLSETGTEEKFDRVYSTLDERLGSRDGFAVSKDKASLSIIESECGHVVAYLSHKLNEAELGASVYGLGILVDPNIENDYEICEAKNSGVLVKVKDLSFVIPVLKDHYRQAEDREEVEKEEESES